MKNIYTAPEVEVIAVDVLNIVNASIGDVDIDVGDNFF